VTAFVQALARSRWRISVTFDGAFVAWTTPATYTLTRADGSPTSVVASRAFATDSTTIELALSEGLLEDVIYTLTATGVAGSTSVSVRAVPVEAVAAADDDPEAEAFGVDVDWLAPALDASGDIPTIRGRDCLLQDLVAIARTSPGELFHRPDAGAGLDAKVNGAVTTDRITADVLREWKRDERVQRVEVRTSSTSDGETTVRGDVVPIAFPTDDPLSVSVTRG
jgi:hypothetical protein